MMVMVMVMVMRKKRMTTATWWCSRRGIMLEALVSLLALLLVAGDSLHYVNYGCPRTELWYAPGSAFEANLNYTLLLAANASSAAGASSSNFSVGQQGPDRVYALFFCGGDVGPRDCHDCVRAAASTGTRACRLLKEAVVWYQECTLRYANRSFFGVEEDAPVAKDYTHSSTLSDYLDQYRGVFDRTMASLASQAAYNTSLGGLGFAEGGANLPSSLSLRGVVQCSPDIAGASCDRCLRAALRLRDSWPNTMLLLPSCSFRFSVQGSIPTTPHSPSSGNQRRSVLVIIVVVAVVGVLFLLLLGGFFLCRLRRHQQQQHQPELAQQQEQGATGRLACFTCSELRGITNGFERQLGEGGFGVVYYGRLTDGREVAVKVLHTRSSNTLASEQFATEVKLLKSVHHKNLVSLVGYCEQPSNLALVYEYLAGGNLQDLLSGPDPLSWKKRVEIAIDAAQGLDYLHNGCRPQIVHRDVKTPNILLNQNLQAKIADFGLSKIFPDDYRRYISTRVIGTPGYLDPQYHVTEHLNDKSDVYSFGVVLLELITGRAAIVSAGEGGEGRTKLVQWVTPLFERGDIESIVDRRVPDVGRYWNSVWAATEVAVKCVKPTAEERPTITDVLTDLRELATRIELDLVSSNYYSSAHSTFTDPMSVALPISCYDMRPAPR